MKFRWWMAPVIGVGICAVANGVLIATAFRVRPQKSEPRPYAASAFEDQRAGERAAFAALGWRLEHAVDATGATLRLDVPAGPRPSTGLVRLYRPDDVASDREVAWPDPAQPLRIDLPRPGAWSLRVSFLDGQAQTVACEARLNRPE